MNETWLLLPGAAAGLTLAIALRRRSQRRRVDAAFAAAVWKRMAPHKRIRPKADDHVQRRRYAR